MAYIKQRHQFLFESIKKEKLEEVYDIVYNQLTKKYGEMGDFPSDIIVTKADGQKLTGRLFVILDGHRGIRFNWKLGEEYANVVSIDLWDDLVYLEGLNDPSYTIELNGGSITNGLNVVYDYFSGSVRELHSDPIGGEAQQEDSKIVSIMDLPEEELENLEMDLFELVKYKVYQIAYDKSKTFSLIITGISGVGKTFEVEKALQETQVDYKKITGKVTTAGLYSALFRYHDQLIMFDDVDSVFKSDDNVNILKGALDSKEVRKISNESATYFATDGMTMDDILANHYGDPSIADNPSLVNPKNEGKMPKSFYFTGKVIFISNLDGDDFDSALITRASAHIDVQMTRQEILDRMKLVMKKIHPEVDFEEKMKVLELIDFLTNTYETKYPLSIRGLYNAIDTMANNRQLKEIGGRKVPIWQIMIKQDMVVKSSRTS